MTQVGFLVSLIFLILKLATVGAFASMTWFVVALPLLIGIAIDVLLFLFVGSGILFMKGRNQRGRRGL